MKKNQALYQRRLALNISQESLAKSAGVSLRAYQNYEENKRTPNVRTAIRIAGILHTDVNSLFSV